MRARLLAGEEPAPAPRGFVGDGSHRCAAVGDSTTGLVHSRVAVCDWDGDGRLDLLAGDAYGEVRFFRNTGTRQAPRFGPAVLLGRMPAWMAPCATDWDGDGMLDVVGGAASGDVWWWRKLGRGAFAAGEPIQVPAVPYGANVAAIDWNEDGDADLLVGTSYGYFCWFERSLLKNGYARAEVVPGSVGP